MSKSQMGHFEIIEGLPADVLAVEAKGHITRAAYEDVLIPQVEAKIAQEGKVKLLYVIGEAFDGFSAGAAWDDTRVGLMHLADFARIAVVSDVDWVRMGVKMFAPLLPAAVRVFHLAELDAAKDWIASNEAAQDAATVDADRKIPPLEDMMPPQG